MDDMNDKIRETLQMMDAMDDDQWTNDGSPKTAVVNGLGELEGVTRAMILEAAPKFSRDNFDVTVPEPEPEEQAEEENTEGYNHPEIIAAQDAYNKAVADLAVAKAAERDTGQKLAEVTNRLMKQTYDKTANTKNVMAAIAASNISRAKRVEEYNATRAMITGKPPLSPLDQAKAGEKKVRPKM